LASVGVSIAVVGPGAIGSTVAACLHQAGRTPLVCGRTARDHLDVRPGPTVLGGERIVVPARVRTDPGEVRQPVELVLLAVKATQIGQASAWLAALCDHTTTVCVLQERRRTGRTGSTALHGFHRGTCGRVVSRRNATRRMGAASRAAGANVALRRRPGRGRPRRCRLEGQRYRRLCDRGLAQAADERRQPDHALDNAPPLQGMTIAHPGLPIREFPNDFAAEGSTPPKLQCKAGRSGLGSSRPRLRTPASAGHPSQSSLGRDNSCVRREGATQARYYTATRRAPELLVLSQIA
jgi:hypothetical protein